VRVVNALKSAWHRKIQPLGVETRKLSKDVSLRREPFLNIPTQRTARGYFSSNKSMPMVDIDFPGGAHLAPQVVHANRKEALRAVKDFLKTRVGKKHRFEVYDTPAGMRLFDVSTRTSPERYDWLAKVLGSDKYYRWASKRKGTFDARLSPKPGRVKGPEYPEGDFVARRLTSIGKGTPLKYSQNELKWFHDNIIRQTLANSNPERTRISMGGLFDLADLSKVLRG
jgi:hypothetical protein